MSEKEGLIFMLKLLFERRSIRKFKDEPIDKNTLDDIMMCALLAPSSRGIKPCEFIVVDDKELLKKLSTSKKHGSSFLSEAALGIVVVADTDKTDVWVEDTSIAAIIIQLAAQKLGLGSCWIQIRKRPHSDSETAENYIRNLLALPDKYAVECIIAIGHPAEIKASYKESDLAYGNIHTNGYSS